jgi:alkylhydroperoxidase family enzyme
VAGGGQALRRHRTRIPDEAFAAAAAQFEPKALADLTIAIGLMNAYNRMAIGFRKPPLAAVQVNGNRGERP